MRFKYNKQVLVTLLAVVMLLTGCTSAPVIDGTETQADILETPPAQTVAETQPETEPRYQVAWAKDAVIYEGIPSPY